ncbi:hypothetical protein Closa_0151 [[Clostridium] saccharolyticum WM1]|uniref:Uncharacterized protein n=2 Tax=Lacrimispora TaxID=2719231 RepID=D9R1Q3_LACSW|nr:hypothetical protein [Lacrimispora saccharolytica]ADL02794.1 hypothetical protein Closa_0151 [[Clostridium] saccharolyticum WM1]
MVKERNHGKKNSILKRMNVYDSSQEKLEAHLLDYMQKHPELTPEPPSPPPGEFQKIMAELNRRGAKTVVRKQLKVLRYGHRFVNSLQKPLLVVMVVLIILAASAIGASAKKANDYRMREQNAGKSKSEVLRANKLSNAYEKIKQQPGISIQMINGVSHELHL